MVASDESFHGVTGGIGGDRGSDGAHGRAFRPDGETDELGAEGGILGPRLLGGTPFEQILGGVRFPGTALGLDRAGGIASALDRGTSGEGAEFRRDVGEEFFEAILPKVTGITAVEVDQDGLGQFALSKTEQDFVEWALSKGESLGGGAGGVLGSGGPFEAERFELGLDIEGGSFPKIEPQEDAVHRCGRRRRRGLLRTDCTQSHPERHQQGENGFHTVFSIVQIPSILSSTHADPRNRPQESRHGRHLLRHWLRRVQASIGRGKRPARPLWQHQRAD